MDNHTIICECGNAVTSRRVGAAVKCLKCGNELIFIQLPNEEDFEALYGGMDV